ncbi:hypothetical transcript [Echinococcus multilocularis]|uniref:Hypothetical transcript n=1 Tax=Echinococcus multilocularis TaxID=6211 RepID=A0A087VX63_ECHMU|nr:hypothetical transcript [Echinococcus multilocularis]
MALRLNSSPSRKALLPKSDFVDHPFVQRQTPTNTPPKSGAACCNSSLDISNFGLFLTIITLIGAAYATFFISIIHIRTFVLEVTSERLEAVRAGALNKFEVGIVHNSWPVYSYPKSADLILDLVTKAEMRLAETPNTAAFILGGRRRLSVHWRDCFTYYPMVMALLIFSISTQAFFRLHPFWRNASPICPLFCLAIFHTTIMIIQLAALFANVKMHRGVDALFKKVCVTCLEDIEKTINYTLAVPMTYCMAPPTDYSTIYLFTLFTSILSIFNFLDSIDSDA